jgi:adenine-specific DNA-methyltransferase
MIKYIGSKRTLVPLICDTIADLVAAPATILDLFSGTSRVGHALKARGYRVIANDHNAYAHTLATCYVQADDTLAAKAQAHIDELNEVPTKPGYFTQTFCKDSRFFQPKNGARIDAIREAIAAKSHAKQLSPELEAVLLVSLMEAADRVDSTTGLQMAYLKDWAPRAHNDLELRLPKLHPRPAAGKCRALCKDALAAAQTPADIAYIDPPYNQHSYLANYHIWETLVRWDKPAHYGVACKRADVRERNSIFNSRRSFVKGFEDLIANVAAPTLVVSFNDEGFLPREDAERILSTRGEVRTLERDYKRYVGAQIGIYNPQGEKVGAVSHLRNKEFLFVVTP